jgi:hypothetical protein
MIGHGIDHIEKSSADRSTTREIERQYNSLLDAVLLGPMSEMGRCCRKSRKSNDVKNLANVDFWIDRPAVRQLEVRVLGAARSGTVADLGQSLHQCESPEDIQSRGYHQEGEGRDQRPASGPNRTPAQPKVTGRESAVAGVSARENGKRR